MLFSKSDRVDPYRNFKFKILIDGQAVAGLHKCSALKKTTEVVTWRYAGDNSSSRKLPGKTDYPAVTLEQGVTQDKIFEVWANKVNNYKGDAAMSLKGFRKDVITIQVNNEQGNPALAYNLYRCWVSEYQALSDLDAGGNAVLISTIKIENEGWERDDSLQEPTET